MLSRPLLPEVSAWLLVLFQEALGSPRHPIAVIPDAGSSKQLVLLASLACHSAPDVPCRTRDLTCSQVS